MKKKSFSSHQITDCDDIYHLYRQLLCEQANQKQIVVCYYCYYYYDYLCITYPWTCTVPLYSRKVAGICIWRAHTAPEHSNGNEWEIYPSFMSLYLFPTERAHIYPKPTSEPANKRAKETWVCLLDSCVAFRFRSHPLLAQWLLAIGVCVAGVCVCVLSKSFLHFGFSRAYIWPFVFFAKAKNFRTSAICWHWTKKPEKSISSTG